MFDKRCSLFQVLSNVLLCHALVGQDQDDIRSSRGGNSQQQEQQIAMTTRHGQTMLIPVRATKSSDRNHSRSTDPAQTDDRPVWLPLPTTKDIEDRGSIAGVVPLAYDVRIRLPVPTHKQQRSNRRYGTIIGSVRMLFDVREATERVFVHVRSLDLSQSTITVTETNRIQPHSADTDDQPSKRVDIKATRQVGAELFLVNTRQMLRNGTSYVLSILDYSGRINGPFSMGIYAGVAHHEPTGSVYTYTTQFQSDWARSAFPCVDHPLFKTQFRLTLEYPPHYKALANSEPATIQPDIGAVLKNGWQRMQFAQTPPIPAYTFGFVLLPSTGYRMMDRSRDHNIIYTNIRLHYNSLRISTNMVRQFYGYAVHSWRTMSHTLRRSKLPQRKLDYVIVPQFKVQGMENWALITLNERYLLTASPALRLSLIAHETVHQWISNLVTVNSWEYLCLQEALTDYYARRIVRQYFGADSGEWKGYIVRKYLDATRSETWRHVPPANLKIGIDPTMEEVSSRCFGKAVFLVDALSNMMRNEHEFDQRVQRFLAHNHQAHFDLKDFIHQFNDIQVGLTPRGPVNASDYFYAWFMYRGYPSVTITRNYSDHTMMVQQNGLFPKAGTYSDLSTLWPISIQLRQEQSDEPINAVFTNQSQMRVDTPKTLQSNDWLLANEGFRQFYRVNYDLHNWQLIAKTLRHTPETFDVIDRIRLVHDFCFFSSIGWLQTTDGVHQQLLEAVHMHPQLFPQSYEYSTMCDPAQNLVF